LKNYKKQALVYKDYNIILNYIIKYIFIN